MHHHVRLWQYTGNHPGSHDCMRYDPHGYGVQASQALAYLIESGQLEVLGVPLEGATVRHGAGDSFGRVVRLKATPEQWEAAKRWDAEINQAWQA